MKLAFSTLGVPGMPIADVVRLAADNGFHGVELRTHPEEPVHPGITLAGREEAVEKFTAAGVQILTVAGDVRVARPGDDKPVLDEIKALLALASDLDATYARVLPGDSERPTEETDATTTRRLAAAAPHAFDLGVRLLLETHDAHRRGADTARLLGMVGHPSGVPYW